MIALLLLLLLGLSSSSTRPLNLVVDRANGIVSVRTYTTSYTFEDRNVGKKVVIDLVSTLHVGDASYYEAIEENMRKYDAVLYELITNNDNTAVDSEMPYRRRLVNDIYSYKAEVLAKEYNLATQLSINFRQSNCYIADLDSETVNRLQSNRKNLILEDFRGFKLGGRSYSQPFLKSFFIDDSSFITFLRLFSWLLPCPELSFLVLDWARTSFPDSAGGVPFASVLIPISQNLLARNFNEVKRIAFAQQLMTGLADSGSFGGEAMSDVDVLVGERNNECIRVLKLFVDDAIKSTSNSDYRIAILYGAYHIKDLQRKLSNMGCKAVGQTNQELTVWNMPYPTSNVSNEKVKLITEVVPIGFFATVYLALGAIDWWVLIKIFSSGFDYVNNYDNNLVVAISFMVGYTALYVQRHLVVFRYLSSSAISWDKPLFD
jgi:hypothetical protein